MLPAPDPDEPYEAASAVDSGVLPVTIAPDLSSLLSNIPNVVTVVDRAGRITYTNHEGLGGDASSMLGERAREFLRSSDRERFDAAIHDVLETEQSRCLDVESGAGQRWEMRLVPLRRNDRVYAVMGISTDVTERRALQDELAHARKLETLGQLSAGVAHNVNNLLTVIASCLQVCERSVPEALVARVRDAEHSALRAAEQLRTVLAFARKEPQRPRTVIDVREAVARTANICRETFGHGIDVELSLPDTPLCVLADAGQIEQVLLNLSLNARDALAGVARAKPVIRLEAEASGRSAILRVSDNGRGMTEEIRSRVFEPFFTTKEPGRGTGLGLATAHRIVGDHGGTIECDSQAGESTSLSVKLPLAAASPR